MTPLDLVSKAKIQRVLDEVAEKFMVHTTLQDSEGTILLEGGGYNPVCLKVRSKPLHLSLICGQSNTSMFHRAIREGSPNSDLCELGMFKTVVPIFHEGSFIGGLSACGVVLEDDLLEPFLVAKTIEIDEKRAESLIKEVSIITERQGQKIRDDLERGFRESFSRSCRPTGGPREKPVRL